MSGAGKLCYKSGGSALAYSKQSGSNAGKLIYKGKEIGGLTMVSFAWGSDGNDLDICAFWNGAPDLKMGYGYNTSKTEQVSGAYHILYSGDIRASSTSEWVKIKMSPWSSGVRTFTVHFNYFGSCDATKCIVVASQYGGNTFVKQDQSCSKRAGNAASTSDPSCVISFDEDGNLLGIQ